MLHPTSAPTTAPQDVIAQIRRELSEATHSAFAESEGLYEARAFCDSRTAPRPTSHRALIGSFVVLGKRWFRTLGQPFINEVLRQQVRFNEALLEAVTRGFTSLRKDVEEERLRQVQFRRAVELRLRELEKDRRR
jgi:hypothetical protein